MADSNWRQLIKPGMTDAERIPVLKGMREECSLAMDNPDTTPDNFFIAVQGWALFTDKLSQLGVPNSELYSEKKATT